MKTVLEIKTLREALTEAELYPETYLIGQVVNNQFATTARSFLALTSESTTSSILTSTEANKLWCQYIVPKLSEMGIGWIDNLSEEATSEQAARIKKDFMMRYMSILNKTYDTYKKLIDILEANKTHLMDGVGAKRVSKFNDTPQVSTDVTGDTYMTNWTQEQSENDLVTKMNRINEIETKLSDYYNLWSNEFGGIFIYD